MQRHCDKLRVTYVTDLMVTTELHATAANHVEFYVSLFFKC